MDLFNLSYNPYDIPPDTTEEEARDILTSHYTARLSIPYATAKELFAIARWNMNGSWMPISMDGLSLEEAVRRAQLRNIVYDQDLVYITTPTEETTLLTNILAEKTQNIQITTETGEKPGEI